MKKYRHPIERDYLVVNFRRSVIIAFLWRLAFARRWDFVKNCCIFGRKRPLTVKFSKLCSESFHRDTDRRCCVGISWNLADGKSVKSCVIYWTKISAAFLAVATAQIAPKICHGQPATMCSECSGFHPNRFTFGGVIAKRVNTAKSPRKVNPIFGRSLDSSRISITIRDLRVKSHTNHGSRVIASGRQSSTESTWSRLTMHCPTEYDSE